MNIVQIHERVRFWVDIVASTRFESQDIDNAVNIAIDNKVRESYDQNRPMNRSDAFQRVQRIRDELGPLVKSTINGIIITNYSIAAMKSSLVLKTSIIDYGWLLAMRVQDADYGSEWHPVFPITHDRKNIVERNPYRKVRRTPESKLYYYEENSGWIILHSFGDLDDVEIHYLATPAIINYGIEYTSAKEFTIADQVIAVTETVYNGTTYKIGEKFTIVFEHLTITSGLVVFSYTECDVRETTHEEISRRAAINCLVTARQNDLANELRKEITAS